MNCNRGHENHRQEKLKRNGINLNKSSKSNKINLNVRRLTLLSFFPAIFYNSVSMQFCHNLLFIWIICSKHTLFLRLQLFLTHSAWIWAKACSFTYICMSLAHQTFWLKRHAMSKSVLHLSTLPISFALSYSLPSSVMAFRLENNNWTAWTSQENGNFNKVKLDTYFMYKYIHYNYNQY